MFVYYTCNLWLYDERKILIYYTYIPPSVASRI